MELVGPGGLLSGLTKTVLETALEAEMSEHLGYAVAILGQLRGIGMQGLLTPGVINTGRLAS